MRIAEFQIHNFKSFSDSGVIELSPTMNIVTGQNNAGKTALLQALELEFPWSENRSINSRPSRNAPPEQPSRIDVTLSLSGSELESLTSGITDLRFEIPPDPGPGAPHPLGIPVLAQYTHPTSIEEIWK